MSPSTLTSLNFSTFLLAVANSSFFLWTVSCKFVIVELAFVKSYLIAVSFCLNCFYSTRKRAIDSLNEKWGLNIKINVNKNISALLGYDAEEQQQEEPVEEI